MADGRTKVFMPADWAGKVSILARPWRTGAQMILTISPIYPFVSILARPWRTGARLAFIYELHYARVSILARPWRTGAHAF